MPSLGSTTQVWYCHPPNKRTEKKAVDPPPASQIPGLGHMPDEVAMASDDDRTFKRKWIRETDSKYVQMAKQGGRRGLLSFREPKPSAAEAVPYPRVDWFDHEHPDEQEEEHVHQTEELQRHEPQKPGYRVLPNWYVHDQEGDEQTMQGEWREQQHTVKQKRNILSWESKKEKEQNGKGSQQKLPPLKHTKEKRQGKPAHAKQPSLNTSKHAVKLPKIPNEPDEINKLMSMGYQHDWFNEQRAERHHQLQEKEEQRNKKRNKRASQMYHAIEMRKPRHATRHEDKQVFKLSKFERVQPRVESFRT